MATTITVKPIHPTDSGFWAAASADSPASSKTPSEFTRAAEAAQGT
jgi:hypothetical protein